jgi:hypothetical protein
LRSGLNGAGRNEKQIRMTQQKTSSATIDPVSDDRRKGVRRTVTITAVIALAFFLVSFVQIVLMK